MATLLLQNASQDWQGIAAIITILLGLCTIVGVLITYILVKPLVNSVREDIMKRLDKLSETLVSKEMFDLYVESDIREHTDMKAQLTAIAANRNIGHK